MRDLLDEAISAAKFANGQVGNVHFVATIMKAVACGELVRATPAALAASPEVQAMIQEAEARRMERAADTIDQMADAIDALIDEIEIFRGMKQSPSRKLMAMAEAVRDRLFRRAGHIPGSARAETARIRAEAAALKGETT